MYKKYFSEFLAGHKDKIHMAGHSHQFWPDITKQAQLEAWELAKEQSDHKWEYLLGTLLPDVQKIISRQLNFPRPNDIAFAPNTHDLITKLISCFFHQEKIRILVSSNEFHSLSRQLKRFSELDQFEIIYFDPESDSLNDSLREVLEENKFDLIFCSHVFYNSGKILEKEIIDLIIKYKGEALFILDAYHGFCAIPTDMSEYHNDIFYMAGGYKYAQSGEGMCFLTLPDNCQLRPAITGWFASFESLALAQSGQTQYSNNGMRFWGSTLDMTPFFRYRSVWKQYHQDGVDIERIHRYVKSLQKQFINNNKLIDQIQNTELDKIGHFITAQFSSNDEAKDFYDELSKWNILTDFRGDKLRFGFSPYLDQSDIEHVKGVINSLKS